MKNIFSWFRQSLPEIELANFQIPGSREEQQDAFGISRLDRYEEDGLFAVLCDGNRVRASEYFPMGKGNEALGMAATLQC